MTETVEIPGRRTASDPKPKHTANCQICESEKQFVAYGSEEPWCKDCGYAPSMLEPDNFPGGCEAHPDATHEEGYGLAGGGCGIYSVCNVCSAIFDKIEDMP